MTSFITDNQRAMRAYCNVWMIKLMKHYQDLVGITLVDCIMATSMFKSTDPRDILYALLGLCAAGAGITPDYHQSVSVDDVSKLVAIKSLVGEQNLKILGLAMRGPSLSNEGNQRSDWPSWVLDLTAQGTFVPLVSWTIRPQQCFHAGGRITPLIVTSKDDKLLHLKGRLIDSVKATARSLVEIPIPTAEDIKPKVGISIMISMWKRNWLQECRAVAADGNWDNMSQAQRRAFAETILCGMAGMRDPASKEILGGFEVYMNHVFQLFTTDLKPAEHVRAILLEQGGLIDASILSHSVQLRFCMTANGRFGRTRTGAREGDLVCVIIGAEIPYILRPTGRGTYTLISDCFLQGMMQGEALTDDSYETVDIILE
jgi:hypothetical protein